jgi:hypothetical protein
MNGLKGRAQRPAPTKTPEPQSGKFIHRLQHFLTAADAGKWPRRDPTSLKGVV